MEEMRAKILNLIRGRGGLGGWKDFAIGDVAVVLDIDDERRRRLDAAMELRIRKRTMTKLRYAYWSTRQKTLEKVDRKPLLGGLVASPLSDNRPNLSKRLRVSTSISSAVVFGSIRALTKSMILLILPQMKYPSESLPPIALPRIVSATTSATSVRKQASPRSSVSRRMASALWTSSCLYCVSCSHCSVTLDG